MAKPSSKTIRTISEYNEYCDEIRGSTHKKLWFRGIGDSDKHSLLPSLYRHPKYKLPEELAEVEYKLTQRFKERSLPFSPPRFDGGWDCLFFMQHYGMPTRLLDWSENQYVGLYFSLTSVRRDEAGKPLTSPAVWALDPAVWNRHALSEISYDKGVLSVGDGDNSGTDYLGGHHHRPGYDGLRKYPVAMYGSHNSPRIVAQRGVFTVSGKSSAGMEFDCDEGGFPAGSLTRIKFARNCVNNMVRSLESIGISDSMIFPDLHGLSLELGKTFGFKG